MTHHPLFKYHHCTINIHGEIRQCGILLLAQFDILLFFLPLDIFLITQDWDHQAFQEKKDYVDQYV